MGSPFGSGDGDTAVAAISNMRLARAMSPRSMRESPVMGGDVSEGLGRSRLREEWEPGEVWGSDLHILARLFTTEEPEVAAWHGFVFGVHGAFGGGAASVCNQWRAGPNLALVTRRDNPRHGVTCIGTARVGTEEMGTTRRVRTASQ